ncbi:MAG: hypothetical protein AAB361_00280 [Patescibacteria group bacterium]
MARINKYEFDKKLRKIPEISRQEREYLNKSFSKDLFMGMTEFKYKERMKKLDKDKKDQIDRWELEKVKKKISEDFGK